MSRKVKTWLIVAVSLIVIGCLIFVGVMTMLKWNFNKLSTSKYQTKDYEITENFEDVFIQTDTANIEFVLSDNENISVKCYEKESHKVEVKENTLSIEKIDNRKWYEYIGINFLTPKITVSIPKGDYGNLLIKTSTGKVNITKDFKFKDVEISLSTGDIKVENLTAKRIALSTTTGKIATTNVVCEEELSVKVSTGKTYLENITCNSLISNGNTGDIFLENVIVAGKMEIKRSTGDIKFDGCDAGEIYIKTSTGSVKGKFKTEKVFIVNTDTGRKEVPNTITGGKCEITTNTGDIIITIN